MLWLSMIRKTCATCVRSLSRRECVCVFYFCSECANEYRTLMPHACLYKPFVRHAQAGFSSSVQCVRFCYARALLGLMAYILWELAFFFRSGSHISDCRIRIAAGTRACAISGSDLVGRVWYVNWSKMRT